ncbi:zinc transporter ZntB [Croceicoccus sp. BE223]|uniref:zinc transporter ZntB n=1 Tax=Croceicoccus sp. BE223 TaxID=2817716 RepID=UPI002866093E|nr:zinc transporter ZntB [Croceicoccus sp. BE223]MDR7102294.1 zinc transporter [Croceicoccus sp. BE223]
MTPDQLDDEADGAGDRACETPLLYGRVLDGKGGGRRIDWAEAQGWTPKDEEEVLWLHLCRSRPGVQDWLESDLGIPEPTAELLVSDLTRPRAFREGDTLIATLRGINFNPGSEPEDMVSMQLWSDGRRVVTLRRLPLQTPRDTLAEIDAGHGPTDAGALITSLTEHMIAHMNTAIIDMNQSIDEMEDAGPDGGTEEVLEEIARIRRESLALKRHMSPQHEALEFISRGAPDWFEPHDRREIAETIARLSRFLDDIDISKESALVLQDDIRARSAARAERTNSLLTIVATLFMPLTFLTGLLGMNVAGIPRADHPLAFAAVVLLCAVILVIQLALFKRWRWF